MLIQYFPFEKGNPYLRYNADTESVQVMDTAGNWNNVYKTNKLPIDAKYDFSGSTPAAVGNAIKSVLFKAPSDGYINGTITKGASRTYSSHYYEMSFGVEGVTYPAGSSYAYSGWENCAFTISISNVKVNAGDNIWCYYAMNNPGFDIWAIYNITFTPQ